MSDKTFEKKKKKRDIVKTKKGTPPSVTSTRTRYRCSHFGRGSLQLPDFSTARWLNTNGYAAAVEMERDFLFPFELSVLHLVIPSLFLFFFFSSFFLSLLFTFYY